MLKTAQDRLALIVSLLIPQAAGAIGAPFVALAIPFWYDTLTLPSFAPPSWLFGPVWTLLYVLMGTSLYMVWRLRGEGVEKARARKRGLTAFGTQLILNTLWPVVFFGFHSPLYALVVMGLLAISIVFTLVYFFTVRPVAAYLLTPYLIWVVFAAVLNSAIVLLN